MKLMKKMDLKTWKKKLIYQSWHRGTKEADVLLGPFADKYLINYSQEQLDQYQLIIDMPDQILVPILFGQEDCPQDIHTKVMAELIAFVRNLN